MKKISLLILVSVLLLLSSCAKEEPIKIGYANVLTTGYGYLGVDGMYGAQLAVKEINENGGINGRKLELIVKDDEGDPQKAVQVDNELKEEGVVAIIGHGLSSVAASIVDNANENDIFLLSPTITTNSLTDLDDNFFRIINTVDEQGITLANLMFDVSEGDTIIFYELNNQAYSLGVVESYVDELETLGITISEDNIHSFENGDTNDYTVASNLINTSDAENVLIVGSAFDVASILQDVTVDKEILLPVWPITSELIGLVGTKIEGAYGLSLYDTNLSTERFQTYVDNYKEEYGQEPSFASHFAYEAVYALAEALKNTDDYSVEGLKEALIEINEIEGVLNNFSFNQYGEVDRELVVLKVVDYEYTVMTNEGD